jgi:hypothetical protein
MTRGKYYINKIIIIYIHGRILSYQKTIVVKMKWVYEHKGLEKLIDTS